MRGEREGRALAALDQIRPLTLRVRGGAHRNRSLRWARRRPTHVDVGEMERVRGERALTKEAWALTERVRQRMAQGERKAPPLGRRRWLSETLPL